MNNKQLITEANQLVVGDIYQHQGRESLFRVDRFIGGVLYSRKVDPESPLSYFTSFPANPPVYLVQKWYESTVPKVNV